MCMGSRVAFSRRVTGRRPSVLSFGLIQYMNSELTRRSLLQGATAAALGPQLAGQSTGAKKMIGIQIGAVSFVDEGVEKVLDILQERAYVNTLFLAVFTYGRGIAGRQVPRQPLPDHGLQKYDLEFHGGNFATC